MATDQSTLLVEILAGADLSANQFYLVDVNGSGQAVVQTSAGGRVAGVNYGNAVGSGVAQPIAIAGIAKVACGAAVTAGQSLKCDATGRAIAVGAGDVAADLAFGIALQNGSGAGSVISVLLTLGATV